MEVSHDTMIEGTIQKWGNSCAIRIPKVVLDQLGLSENAPVVMAVVDNQLVVKKSRRYRSFEEIMEGYDGDYVFTEMDSGPPVGREVF